MEKGGFKGEARVMKVTEELERGTVHGDTTLGEEMETLMVKNQEKHFSNAFIQQKMFVHQPCTRHSTGNTAKILLSYISAYIAKLGGIFPRSPPVMIKDR